MNKGVCMTVGFSPSVSNYNVPPKKNVAKSAITAAAIGGGVAGALNLAGQQYIKSNPGKIVEKAFQEGLNGKPGFFTDIVKEYANVIVLQKFNWKKVGKTALFGAALFGAIKAITTSCKNNKIDKAAPSQSMNYMA